MENDVNRIKLMNSLLLSMPGSPILYYGDEIGMGDNIYLGDRNGVRTPMQWSPDRNAGFSRADPQRLYLPPIMDAIYGYESVNVEAQLREPSSLLNWTRRMLAVRKSFTVVRPRAAHVPASPATARSSPICASTTTKRCCASPISPATRSRSSSISRASRGACPVELMGRTPFPPIGDLPYLLTLAGHGFLWFRLAAGADVPAWHEERLPRDELPVLVLFDGWASLFRERVVPWRIALAEKGRAQFERDVLPPSSPAGAGTRQKARPIKRVALSRLRGVAVARTSLADRAGARRERGRRAADLLPAAHRWPGSRMTSTCARCCR